MSNPFSRRSFFARLLAGAIIGVASNLPMPATPKLEGIEKLPASIKPLYELPKNTAIYVGLLIPESKITELNGVGYARVPLESLSDRIYFPKAKSEWGTVAGFGLFDREIGGRLLHTESLPFGVKIENGYTFSVDMNVVKCNNTAYIWSVETT